MSGYLDERQFSDELQLRRGFLASLRDHPSAPEIDDRIREIESEISALRGEDIGTTMMTDMNDQYGPYASSSSMSTPMSSDPGESASHRLNVPSRKRSIGSSHLDVNPVDRSKRATPTTTPVPTKPASPSAMSFGSASSEDGKLSSPQSVIDLTDEDKVWLQREGERFNSRNPYERMALANNWGYILNDADSLSSTSMTLARRPHPPNGQSSYTGQNNGSHLSGYRARTPNYNQPAPQLATWQSNGPQLQGSYGSLPGPSSHQYWMPGAYVDSDSDGEQHVSGPLSTANSHVSLLNSSSPGSQFNPSGTSHQQQQISSNHGLHRQAPVLQQTGSIAFGANRQLPPLPALPVQTYTPMDFRCFPINAPLPTNQMPLGYSGVCGMYAPITPDRPDMLDSGLYLPQPQGLSLAELTAQTSGIDYGSGLDVQGNPLNPRLTNFLHGDSPYDSEREKKEIVDLLSNIQTDVHVLKEDIGTPDGMKYPLYDHQKLGLKWMTQMEKGTNRGGILADDMGLGKTITALALIVTRQSETAFKTNLIIGPVALIRQWELEIQNKLNLSHKMGILLLHQKRKLPFSEIKKYDVVLTTYGSIAAEWKQYEKHIEQRQASALYSEEADAELAKKCPLLHPKSRFHRIILDEAQCIKNKDTQGAKGVHKIEATYRWCLTGTPIMNNVTELYSLFRFLKIKPYSDFKLFQRAFKSLGPRTTGTNNNRSQAMKQLRAVLQATMLRRMKNSVINGKPILTLPPKNEYSELVQFSEEELQFYKDLENRSQVVLNRYLRASTVGKNYSNILVLLLRLRQACCHPHLTEFETVSSPAADDESLLALAKEMDEAVVTRVREIEAFECPICYDAVDDPLLLLPCGHDVCSECFSSLQGSEARSNIREGNGQDPAGICCPVCRGTSKKSIKYSVFVKAHVPEKLGAGEEALPDISDWDDSSDDDDDNEADDESAGSLADFVVDDDEDELDDDAKLDAELSAAVKIKKEEESKSTMKAPKKKGKSKKDNKPIDKGKNKDEPVEPSQLRNLRDEAAKNMAARRRYMKYLHDNWEDSAKVTKVLELLTEIQKTNEKTIIFSQWTSLLDLIECQVKSKLNIEYCRYAGNMSRSQRDEAVADFVGNPKNRVMLVSLRAGNAGLNLTVASRIIICDPFWNPYIEMQAVDRAHRIGQQREVQVHRILVKETVEDRILNLQQQKRELVDSALNEGRDKNAARLNNDQLRYLFGVGNLPPAHG